ncbi:hypothetical protein I316_02518 [Kwoniella heveanensis BCC8398]|uniref:Uncharacterized protein n=1 Tax=Kwoniella heveanensis BCC8398 TaxID=1296120 RepID=A0A1B9GYD7_9TREE|nr:hypothetical protein I316_02518 [Kwoniella heveanensis BCC8398]
MSANDILRRAHYLALLLVLGYAVLLALLTIPAIQRELLFLHHVPIPLFPDYANPERYSLAPFKTRNLWLNTSDGEAIGAWHVLPRSVYGALQPFPPRSELDDNLFDEAFSQRPTIIYFHGNAGNRATSHRVRSYSAFSTNLDCNVLAIDYRGFGDSSGTPSEEGLLTDARAAYDYVAQRVARSSHTIRTKQKDTDIATAGEVKLEGEEGGTGRDGAEKNIVLVGQSLGTGVVSGLAGRLAQEGFFQSFLYHTFDSKAALANTFSPTLLLHAINDHTIPHSHSDDLFNSLTLPTTADTNGPAASASTMEAVSYEGWGTVRTVDRGQKGQVIWWEGKNGGHDNLGWAEGTLDLIARIANL